MKKRGLMVLLLVAILLPEYARWMIQNETRAGWMVRGEEIRPYVYRALVPFVGRVLTWLGLSPMQAMSVAVILSAIGLFCGLIYFFKSFER